MIKLPNLPKIVKKETNKVLFEIDSLYPGYGVTIGNALRRVLLSSLPGAAITQVKIKGVPHEFSTIPGILEDVITIMLNLKELRFRVFSPEPQKASFKIKGKKEVKSSDFKLPAQVELVNKNNLIATLTSASSELEMEIQIEKGVGYYSREARKKEKLEIGAISVDAIFTPVKKVSYRVENMRVGERTDYDRLFLEIETDGTIKPEDAFLQASEILVNHFKIFVPESQALSSKDEVKAKKSEKTEPKKKKSVKADSKESGKKAKVSVRKKAKTKTKKD